MNKNTSTYTAEQITRLHRGNNISRFNNLSTAKSVAARGSKIQAILHGDDGTFWMTTPAIAAKLERGGYEIVAYAH